MGKKGNLIRRKFLCPFGTKRLLKTTGSHTTAFEKYIFTQPQGFQNFGGFFLLDFQTFLDTRLASRHHRLHVTSQRGAFSCGRPGFQPCAA